MFRIWRLTTYHRYATLAYRHHMLPSRMEVWHDGTSATSARWAAAIAARPVGGFPSA